MLTGRVTYTTFYYGQSNKEMKDMKPHHVARDLMDHLEHTVHKQLVPTHF